MEDDAKAHGPPRTTIACSLRATQKYVQRIAPYVELRQVTALIPIAIPTAYGGRNVQDILASGVRRWQPSGARLLHPHLWDSSYGSSETDLMIRVLCQGYTGLYCGPV